MEHVLAPLLGRQVGEHGHQRALGVHHAAAEHQRLAGPGRPQHRQRRHALEGERAAREALGRHQRELGQPGQQPPVGQRLRAGGGAEAGLHRRQALGGAAARGVAQPRHRQRGALRLLRQRQAQHPRHRHPALGAGLAAADDHRHHPLAGQLPLQGRGQHQRRTGTHRRQHLQALHRDCLDLGLGGHQGCGADGPGHQRRRPEQAIRAHLLRRDRPGLTGDEGSAEGSQVERQTHASPGGSGWMDARTRKADSGSRRANSGAGPRIPAVGPDVSRPAELTTRGDSALTFP